MGRRKKSDAKEIIRATASFPWWAGVIAALVSYFGLHLLAGLQITAPATDLQQLGIAAAKQFAKGLASIFQYVFPVMFLAGSVWSIFRRRKRCTLYRVTTTDDHLAQMSWQDFELLVGEFFRRRGFSVKEVGGGGSDGGVDLIVSTASDRYVVQCKKWKAMAVPVTTVRELYGVMSSMGAAGAFVVTAGAFTRDAQRFAEGREIELIRPDYLLKEIGRDQIADRSTAKTDRPSDAPQRVLNATQLWL